MGWVLATLLTLGGVGWLLFVMPEKDDDDPTAPVQELGTQATTGLNQGMSLEYLAGGWNPTSDGIDTYIGNIQPTAKSAFNWNGWGVIVTQTNVDARGRRYYDLRIDFGYNRPADETGNRFTFVGPLTQTTNCDQSAMPISCRMMNELKRDLEEAIEAGVIVPNGAT